MSTAETNSNWDPILRKFDLLVRFPTKPEESFYDQQPEYRPVEVYGPEFLWQAWKLAQEEIRQRGLYDDIDRLRMEQNTDMHLEEADPHYLPGDPYVPRVFIGSVIAHIEYVESTAVVEEPLAPEDVEIAA